MTDENEGIAKENLYDKISYMLIVLFMVVCLILFVGWWLNNHNKYIISVEPWNDTITGNCDNTTLPRIRLYNQSYCKLDCGILKGILNISMATQLAMPPQKLNIPTECNYTCYGELVGWSC